MKPPCSLATVQAWRNSTHRSSAKGRMRCHSEARCNEAQVALELELNCVYRRIRSFPQRAIAGIVSDTCALWYQRGGACFVSYRRLYATNSR